MSMADGVVGRGVLLDVPRALGSPYLDPGEVVTVADLEATEQAQGVTVGPGDILLVAWGREARRAATRGFDGFSGLHADCLPWLHEREVAVLGQRRDLRPDAVRGHAGLAVPRPPDRHHRHGPPPDRQRGRWPPLGATVCRRSAGGSSSSPWHRCGSPRGPGCPVNPVAVL